MIHFRTTVATAATAALFALSACQPGDSADKSGEASANAAASEPAAATVTVDGLQMTDITIGDGAEAIQGRPIVVHYTGWLYDPAQPDNKGAKFDSSLDRGQPFSFPLGAGRVIRGWDQGFKGMRVGGKRVLVIPPEMAYGANGVGSIPPNSTLMFEVDLLEVR